MLIKKGMKETCPYGHQENGVKNGKSPRGIQRYLCRGCGRSFQEWLSGYHLSQEQKDLALWLYLEGMGFRGIGRIVDKSAVAILSWIRRRGQNQAKALPPKLLGTVEWDELCTYVGKKIHKVWLWWAYHREGREVLDWQLGDRSAQTFEPLWQRLGSLPTRLHASDDWVVYSQYLPPERHVRSKVQAVHVENLNTRVRHYLARLHRKTFCYSKSVCMLHLSILLLVSHKLTPST